MAKVFAGEQRGENVAFVPQGSDQRFQLAVCHIVRSQSIEPVGALRRGCTVNARSCEFTPRSSRCRQ
jgi:hypothetical protein